SAPGGESGDAISARCPRAPLDATDHSRAANRWPDRSGPGDDVDEVLEVLGRPAFERLGRVRLVGGHHRVAVVPVEARLRVQPEGPAGALGEAGEGGGVGVAPVRPRVAEDDHGRAGVEVGGDLLEELEPDPAVVGVAGDVGDAAVLADPLADLAEVALALERLGDLADSLDEDEAAELAER